MIRLARAWKAAALFFSTLAAIFGGLYLRMKWVNYHADFDVLGVLWLLENLGPIASFLLFLVCLLGAVYFWIRYALADR